VHGTTMFGRRRCDTTGCIEFKWCSILSDCRTQRKCTVARNFSIKSPRWPPFIAPVLERPSHREQVAAEPPIIAAHIGQTVPIAGDGAGVGAVIALAPGAAKTLTCRTTGRSQSTVCWQPGMEERETVNQVNVVIGSASSIQVGIRAKVFSSQFHGAKHAHRSAVDSLHDGAAFAC